jgi:HD-GYP domain-containing protein (c-di-GMP phosphodiesterase class II)
MLQNITRNELKPGMFVVSHGAGHFHAPIVNVGRCLSCAKDLDDLVPREASIVTIDPERSVLVEPSSLAREVPAARRLYAESLRHVHGFMDAVRQGTEVDPRECAPFVNGFIDSVFRNESAAATLFKLRDYDAYTYTHSLNVSVLAVLLGKRLGLDKIALSEVGVAAMLHDLGKARIPEAILNKPGKLTPTEFAVMKTHPEQGHALLQGRPGMTEPMLRAVLEHHERRDGTGYPRGLKEQDIGLYSRIVSVADVYDALTSRRVYKEPMAPAKALGLMYQWRDRDFTPLVIEQFIRCLGVYPLGSLVQMSSGEHALVVGTNPLLPTRPVVRVILDAKMRSKPTRTVDLSEEPPGDAGLSILRAVDPASHNLNLEHFFL